MAGRTLLLRENQGAFRPSEGWMCNTHIQKKKVIGFSGEESDRLENTQGVVGVFNMKAAQRRGYAVQKLRNKACRT